MIKEILIILIICIVGFWIGILCRELYNVKRRCNEIQKTLDKVNGYYHLFDEWLFLKQHNVSVADMLAKIGYNKIGIYGMKEIGQRLYDELKNSQIEVVCLMDQNKDGILGDYEIIGLDESIPKLDAIVVTAYYYFPEIEKKLAGKINCPILSFEHIVFNAFV